MKKSTTLYIINIIGLLLFLLTTSCQYFHANKKHKIVVLQSFEADYAGYKDIEKKLSKEFEKQGIDADIRSFYLDCESYLDKEEKERMYHFLDTMAAWKPDIIQIFDDQATYSFMACGHPLTKQLPVVFAGVNYPNWELLKQYPNITGFWDKPDFVKCVDMIEEIFGPMRILFWLDNTYLGKQSRQLLINEFKTTGTNRFEGTFAKYLNADENLQPKISPPITHKPDITYCKALNAREISSQEFLWSLSGLSRYSAYVLCKYDFTIKRLGLLVGSPTFTVINEEFGLGKGYLGGYLTSVEKQNQLSVQTVSNILKGTDVQQIPITETPKEYLLDWLEIERWEIPMDHIPKNYQIINRPFIDRYRSRIILFSSIGGILILLTIAYLIVLYRQENRKKQLAQEKQKKGERFLSLALAGGKVFAFQLKDGIFYFDNDFYMAAGLKEGPIATDQYYSYLHPSDVPLFNSHIENAQKGIIQENISQVRCNFEGKQYQWWEFRYTYNPEEDLFSGLCLNIQPIKQAEFELIVARQKAEESDKMKSAFLANMSHEIRTPLNAIVGFSNLIGTEEVELSADEKKEFLGLINSNCQLLLKLINDILDLSRIESGRMDFIFSLCNLTDLINEIFGTHQLLMPPDVELKKETPEIPLIIETDHFRFTQVITNLINNAAKFTKSGYIKIGYQYIPGAPTVDIFVEDTGIGIPEEKREAIFERFNKLDEFAQGTGLGLAICQVIIKRFEGKINLTSGKEQGSCFTITLPVQHTK